MYRKEVNESSPLRVLQRSTHGGPGAGKLSVVMARAGVGKTAFLVHVGLDEAMRERNVLHVTGEQGLEHLHGWYDAIFADMAAHTHLEDRDTVRSSVNKHRVLHSCADRPLSPEHLDSLVTLYKDRMGFSPDALVLDGYKWEQASTSALAGEIEAFKALAKRLSAELWMTAQTHRGVTVDRTPPHPTQIMAPCGDVADLIDVALFLEPENTHVTVRLLKDHDNAAVAATHLQLDCDTLRLRHGDQEEKPSQVRLPVRSYTLLSGGNTGAEAAFGEAAERWGIGEVNFSFSGRKSARNRNIVELTEAQLEQGAVGEAYLQSHLHRAFPQTEMFQKMLQSIWHQVHTSGQVFVIGFIQADNTVKGGTGWAVELARHFRKPVAVFDQERKGWYDWDGAGWKKLEQPPVIARRRFTGTGTRFIDELGRAAIVDLFTRSFGAPPSTPTE